MTGIGKVDQIVLQLRSQLQRAARNRSKTSGNVGRTAASPLQRFKALEGVEAYGDGELRRKFVRALLTEELGEELANQPEFERISNEVWKLIEEDEALRPELDQALRQLGQG